MPRNTAIIVYMTVYTIWIGVINGQTPQWNLLLDKQVGRYVGNQVYETDSFYYVVGTSIDTFGTPEQGFSVSKVDKTDAHVVATHHYEEPDVELDFNQCRQGFRIGKYIYFSVSTFTKPNFLGLYQVDIHTLAVEKLLHYTPQDTVSNYTLFLKDVLAVEDDIYILTKYNVIETSTSEIKGENILVRYNLTAGTTHIIMYIPRSEKTVMKKIEYVNGQLITFGSVVGSQLATGKMNVTAMDRHGNELWQYETPSLSHIHNVKDIYPLKGTEVLLVSYEAYYNYAEFKLYARWIVTRYDIADNKILWSRHWDEPRKTFIYDTARIIASQNEGEYFLMANDYEDRDSTGYETGKVIKFNEKGERIWQKIYYYNNEKKIFNDFYSMIATYDGHYLISGYESYGKAPWLVKINEDGEILPRDTTSSTQDQVSEEGYSEITVYPNPATHTIVIHQGDIADVTYFLVDKSGQVVDDKRLCSVSTTSEWHIRHIPPGIYYIIMTKAGRVLGSRQQIILR